MQTNFYSTAVGDVQLYSSVQLLHLFTQKQCLPELELLKIFLELLHPNITIHCVSFSNMNNLLLTEPLLNREDDHKAAVLDRTVAGVQSDRYPEAAGRAGHRDFYQAGRERREQEAADRAHQELQEVKFRGNATGCCSVAKKLPK